MQDGEPTDLSDPVQSAGNRPRVGRSGGPVVHAGSRTLPFHGRYMGSNPIGVINL